jgi:hypothetical protein
MARKKKKKGGSEKGAGKVPFFTRIGRGMVVALATVTVATPITMAAAMAILRWDFTVTKVTEAFYFAMIAVPVQAALAFAWTSMLRAKPAAHPWMEALLFTIVATPFTALVMLYYHQGWTTGALTDLVVGLPKSVETYSWHYLGFLFPSIVGMRAGLGAVNRSG